MNTVDWPFEDFLATVPEHPILRWLRHTTLSPPVLESLSGVETRRQFDLIHDVLRRKGKVAVRLTRLQLPRIDQISRKSLRD